MINAIPKDEETNSDAILYISTCPL